MTPAAPVGVVVVTRNRPDLLRVAAGTVVEQGVAVEGVVVDNGPDDETRAVAEELGWRYLTRGRNLSFAEANDWAIGELSAERALLLNNDAQLTAGSLEAMLGHDAPVVGALILDEDGTVNHAGVRIALDDGPVPPRPGRRSRTVGRPVRADPGHDVRGGRRPPGRVPRCGRDGRGLLVRVRGRRPVPADPGARWRDPHVPRGPGAARREDHARGRVRRTELRAVPAYVARDRPGAGGAGPVARAGERRSAARGDPGRPAPPALSRLRRSGPEG